MRALRRPAILPPTLRDDGAGGRAALRHREQRVADASCKLTFVGHWTEPDVRGALCAMQGWVCAYCQCEIDPRDGGDVDHFRPKGGEWGGYWWLVYRFDNYFLSCRRCNEHLKRELFPVRDGRRAGGPDDDIESCEHRLLVDPVRDAGEVEAWFRVDVLDAECRVVPCLSDDNEHPMRERVAQTETLFALNSLDALRPRIRLRNKLIDLRKSSDDESARRRAGRYQPWSATAREALQTFAHRLPLPSPEEELCHLLDQLLEHVTLGWRLHEGGRLDAAGRRRLEEIGWTLAFLWADPPTGDAAVVERWLDAHRLRPWVEPFRAQLAPPTPA